MRMSHSLGWPTLNGQQGAWSEDADHQVRLGAQWATAPTASFPVPVLLSDILRRLGTCKGIYVKLVSVWKPCFIFLNFSKKSNLKAAS